MEPKELKKKKFDEYLASQNQDVALMQQMAQIQEEFDKAMMYILTSEAKQRLNNIKYSKPEFAFQVQLYLLQLYQAGQIRKPLSEQELKNILNTFVKKPTWNIKRR